MKFNCFRKKYFWYFYQKIAPSTWRKFEEKKFSFSIHKKIFTCMFSIIQNICAWISINISLVSCCMLAKEVPYYRCAFRPIRLYEQWEGREKGDEEDVERKIGGVTWGTLSSIIKVTSQPFFSNSCFALRHGGRLSSTKKFMRKNRRGRMGGRNDIDLSS